MAEQKNPFHKIEDIKRKLYERGFSSEAHHKEGVLHSVPHDVANSWDSSKGNTTIKPVHISFAKKFFIGAVGFFLVAVAFGVFMYMRGTTTVSNDNIEITVLGNAFTQGGEELPLQIEIVNKNNAALELANLTIEYPRGASNDTSSDVIRLPREQIGRIPAGGRVEKSQKVTLYGDQGTIRNVVIKLEYHPEGSNAIFTKEKSYPVTISSSPLSLTVDGVTQTSSNQEITLNITATLNTSLPSTDTMLKVEYPSGFKFSESVPKPSLSNSLWSLSSLAVGKPTSIIVKGTLSGQDGDEKVFRIYVGSANANNKSVVDVVYNSLLHTIALQKPFLQATVTIEGQDLDQYSSQGGKLLRGQVLWANNLPNRILDAEVSVRFSGNVFNKEAVNPGEGFFDSINNQIIWNRNTNSEFAALEPGATGHVEFTFTPLSIIGTGNSIRDPQVILEVSIKGREGSDILSEVNNFAKKIIRISSDFQIAARASYTSGELPPKAERPTTYTINWTLSNSVNTVTGAEARATLPVYVKWGGLAAGSSENVTYDSTTHEIVWNIGTVKPNTGFGSGNKEIAFNVILTPSVSQVGSVLQLQKELTLTGIDSFAGSALKSTKQPLTTRLDNDPNFKFGDETVVR